MKFIIKKPSMKKDIETIEKNNLSREIVLAKNALMSAQSNFNNATDPLLIDCYIYQVQSEELRYKFLLSRAKELKL